MKPGPSDDQLAAFWQGVREDYARLIAHPMAWDDYQAEIALWDQTSGDGLELEVPYYTPEEESLLDAEEQASAE